MGILPEVKLVIKHTFLEYVGDGKASDCSFTRMRERSNTEPVFVDNLCYGEVREMLHGGSASSSDSGYQGDPSVDDLDSCSGVFPSSPAEDIMAVLATPEATPLLHPTASHLPGWLVENWTEAMLPEAFCAPQVMDDYCRWNDQYSTCDWWGQASFPLQAGNQYDVHAPMTCESFQVDCQSMHHPMYAPASFDNENYNPSQPSQQISQASRMPSAASETRTTVMLRDLPEAFSRSALLRLLDSQGFFGRFDFLYLPVDFKREKNLGYALINLVSPYEALRFTNHFEGFSNLGMATDKVCSVGWCSPQQGLEAHVERYRNSPVMHESVPSEWQPMLLSHGVPIPFPAPTQKIKAPKVKGGKR